MASESGASTLDRSRQGAVSKQACTLPLEQVFSIQIGSELFRLSGASIASDGWWRNPSPSWDAVVSKLIRQQRRPTSRSFSKSNYD